MKAISLEYHDVVENDNYDGSGFLGANSARYKMNLSEFASQLEQIKLNVKNPPSRINTRKPNGYQSMDFYLTFDDGGASSHTIIATCLEKMGWSGHFFVTTDFIGNKTFLDKEQILDLHKRGHIIGSHSSSHPEMMSSMSKESIYNEWKDSVYILSEIIGEPVKTASLPGGFYSKTVAEAASKAGITTLFTSEPTTNCQYIENCLVIGRYTIYRGMSPQSIAAIAQGKTGPRVKQYLSWNTKKLAKKIGGKGYLKFRRFILNYLEKDNFNNT